MPDASADTAAVRRARMVALYLPQFHPIPENDAWWGEGFTEWTNVRRAKPLFPGHHQPRRAGELGYYDLRDPAARAAQAALAAEHGIEAFCYYHYWFAGRLLLERPLLEVLRSGQPDFPFCVCWANDTWSGVWYGNPDRVLVEQTYPGPDDDERHFDWLLPALSDRRYLKVDGRPLLLVYHPEQLPEPERTADLWRRLACRNGLPGIHLVGMSNAPCEPGWLGFDAVVRLDLERATFRNPHLLTRVRRKLQPLLGVPRHTYSFRHVLPLLLPEDTGRPDVYPCVIHDWDNSPRSGARGVILQGASPRLFERLLARVLAEVAHKPFEHRLVFLKSWNEWAESNALEPDDRDGRAYLEVVARLVLGKASSGTSRPRQARS